MHFTDANKPTGKSDYGTPQALFDKWHYQYNFTIDAAASATNAKMPRYWSDWDNALSKDWTGERVFINPPYGRQYNKLWLRKIYNEAVKGVFIAALIPASTGALWFHDYVFKAVDDGIARIEWHKGRIQFDGAIDGAKFDTVLAVYHGG